MHLIRACISYEHASHMSMRRIWACVSYEHASHMSMRLIRACISYEPASHTSMHLIRACISYEHASHMCCKQRSHVAYEMFHKWKHAGVGNNDHVSRMPCFTNDSRCDKPGLSARPKKREEVGNEKQLMNKTCVRYPIICTRDHHIRTFWAQLLHMVCTHVLLGVRQHAYIVFIAKNPVFWLKICFVTKHRPKSLFFYLLQFKAAERIFNLECLFILYTDIKTFITGSVWIAFVSIQIQIALWF